MPDAQSRKIAICVIYGKWCTLALPLASAWLSKLWCLNDRCAGTIWKLCEPQQRESGNITPGVTLCPSTVWPRRNFFNLWAILHSEPLPGINDFQKYIQSWTCVWEKFSPYTGMMYDVVHWYSVIIISSIGSPMFTWLSSFLEETNTKCNVMPPYFDRFKWMQHRRTRQSLLLQCTFICLFLLLVLLKNIPVSNSAVSTGQCYIISLRHSPCSRSC